MVLEQLSVNVLDSSMVFAARAGRIAFGAYLSAGAVAVVLDARSEGPWGTCALFVSAWIVAFAMGYAVRASVGPRPATSGRWLLASLVLPGIGVSLMTPLLVHLPIIALAAGGSGFDSWVETSIAVVGPTHLALAVLVVMRAIGLVRGSFTPSPGFIYVVCVAVAFATTAGLLFIPTILVALTGIAIVPLLRHMETLVDAERALEPGVPRAIIRADRRA